MDVVKFKKIMALWDLRAHQDHLVYFKRLEEYNYTLDDVEEFIRLEHERKVNDKNLVDYTPITKQCPICGNYMRLLAVNNSPSTMTGDPLDKSVWMCINPLCQETIFNEFTINELARKVYTELKS